MFKMQGGCINKAVFIFALFAFSPLSIAQTNVINDGSQVEGKTINAGQISELLKHLGYPENTWEPIKKEIVVLLSKIDFPHLKKEAEQAKSDPIKLKQFVQKLGSLIEKQGYFDRDTPHPLVKSLAVSLVNDDISQVIFTSPISFVEKVDSKKALVACTAISQLGSIVLDLLDIKVKAAFSPAHVFNCIPLNAGKILIVDFSNQIFEIVDIDQYYLNLGTRTMMLKDEYRVSPARLLEINGQLPSEYQTDSLHELLCFLYDYVYISDNDATTPGILMNLGNIYSRKGNYEQSISDYNEAIEMEPEYPEGYRERGVTYGNKGDLDQAIVDLNKAIELFPDFSEGFHDRAGIYSSRGDIDNAISDYNQAIIINPDYVEAYHDRGKLYDKEGNTDQAIADYDKAIEIDPYFSEGYQSRAQAYFSQGKYDECRKDIHKIEDFGDDVDPDLLDKLQKSSESKRILLPALIIAPILILLMFSFF